MPMFSNAGKSASTPWDKSARSEKDTLSWFYDLYDSASENANGNSCYSQWKRQCENASDSCYSHWEHAKGFSNAGKSASTPWNTSARSEKDTLSWFYDLYDSASEKIIWT